MTESDAIHRIAAFRVQDLAPELGLKIVRGSSLAPCPVCGDEVRGRSTPDPRGPVGFRRNGRAWCCHRCKVKGGTVELICYALFGERLRRGDRRWGGFFRWAASRGLCEGHEDRARGPTAPKLRPLPNVPMDAPPRRPPRAEVDAVWQATQPLSGVPEVRDYVVSRSLDAAAIEWLDLARAVPRDAPLAPWAQCRRTSWAKGWQLVVPLFDARGVMASVHARAAHGAAPKGVSPAGFEIRGLVLADGFARQLLKLGELPDWWRSDAALRIFITEGVPDFLKAATSVSEEHEAGPAVFGVLGGSWCPEIAARIPNGARIFAATHDDPAGEEYARKVAATLSDRCAIFRVHPSGESRKARDD